LHQRVVVWPSKRRVFYSASLSCQLQFGRLDGVLQLQEARIIEPFESPSTAKPKKSEKYFSHPEKPLLAVNR
jgi:hypothetical protein